MARLLAFGGRDNGKAQLDALDTVDLEAIETAQELGWLRPQKVVHAPIRPCPRPNCGGAILTWYEESLCLLCSRPPQSYYEPGRGVCPAPLNGRRGPRTAQGAL